MSTQAACHCEYFLTCLAGSKSMQKDTQFERGIQSMEAGSWESASSSFSDALHNSQGDAKGRAAQYLAAVKLCKVRARSSFVLTVTKTG